MKTRANIFETNSSSTHSFVLRDKNPDYIIPVINNIKTYKISCGEYGWGYEKLTSWQERAEYLATYAVTCGGPEAIAKFEKEMSDYLKVPVKIAMPREISYDDGESYSYKEYENDYIDHQSVDYAAKMFEDIKTTVFSKNGMIEIDNDNHG